MIPPGVAERLQAHAAAVVASASVPASEREELTEELYGHLLERCRALVDAGMDPMLAADRAIADFGSADRIGSDLTRTYRGRLWASTIGVLLPAMAASDRPLAVSLMAGLSFLMAAVFVLVGTVVFLNSPPLHAILLGLGGAMPAIGACILGLGLLRAQRWALAIGIGGCVALVGSGLYDLTRSTFSLTGAWAALALVAYLMDRGMVHRWLSPRPAPRLAVAGLITLLATPLLGGPVSSIPDPTQAGPDDLTLIGTMDCGAMRRIPAETADMKHYESTEPAIVVTVEFTWDRTSLLPGGILGSAPVDNLVIEAMPLDWAMIDDRLTDVATGEEVPGSGGLGPGGPSSVEERSWSAAIPREEIRTGRAVRFEITLVDQYLGPRTAPLPHEQARASYWHADAFVKTVEFGCAG